ncbi:MAG TPA: hypothetical protein EYG73_00680 [Arcobacter sp.]|nr:hypothetical protein [Arcobacter sp.]
MFIRKLLKVGLVGLFTLNVLYAETVRITKDTANVRSGASTQNRIIGKAHKGDGYNLLRSKGGWVKISFRGDYGWISKSLVNIESDSREEEIKSGCIEADIASWIPTALNAICCGATIVTVVGCVACTVVFSGGELAFGDSMDRALEGALCD